MHCLLYYSASGMHYYHIISRCANIAKWESGIYTCKNANWGRREGSEHNDCPIGSPGAFQIVPRAVVRFSLIYAHFPPPRRFEMFIAWKTPLLSLSFVLSGRRRHHRPYSRHVYAVPFPGSYGAKTVKSRARSQISYSEFWPQGPP